MQDHPSSYNSQMNPQFPEQEHLKCPRCDSLNTKFCYYNNYNLSQPRHFCKNCRRYWTKGGTLRNIPIGGGSRKNTKRSSNPKRYSSISTQPKQKEEHAPSSYASGYYFNQDRSGGSFSCSLLEANGRNMLEGLTSTGEVAENQNYGYVIRNSFLSSKNSESFLGVEDSSCWRSTGTVPMGGLILPSNYHFTT